MCMCIYNIKIDRYIDRYTHTLSLAYVKELKPTGTEDLHFTFTPSTD